MGLSINTNIPSITAQRTLERTLEGLERSMKRLATGNKINSAADDAAGLQRMNRMTTQIQGLEIAVRNAYDAKSVVQTAEGAMTESTAILQRIRNLALVSANGSNNKIDRQALDNEAQQMILELKRISVSTSFAGTTILDGSYGSRDFQVGANANEVIGITLSSVAPDNLGTKGKELFFQETTQGVPTQFTLQQLAPLEDQIVTFKEVNSGIAYPVEIKATMTAADAAKAIEDSVEGVAASSKGNAFELQFKDGSGTIVATETMTVKINGEVYPEPFKTDAETTFTNLATTIQAGGIYDAEFIKNTASDMRVKVTTDSNEDITVEVEPGASKIGSADFVIQALEWNDVAAGATAAGAGSMDIKGWLNMVLTDDTLTYDVIPESGKSLEGATGPANGIFAQMTGNDVIDLVDSIDISDYEGAQRAIPIVDTAMAQIDEERGALGAAQNRLQHTVYNLMSINENMKSSLGRLKDTDYAYEMAELSRQEVLKEAALNNLAKSNAMQASILNLIKEL